jgi:hypothetical protein
MHWAQPAVAPVQHGAQIAELRSARHIRTVRIVLRDLLPILSFIPPEHALEAQRSRRHGKSPEKECLIRPP